MQVAFFNPQGNFHPQDLYLTEHPDFGGQLIYVKEVATALARQGLSVDIITRRIRDEKMKGFEEEVDGYPGVSGLRILRIPFGGDAFLPKEDLWMHLSEYVQGIMAFYQKEGSFPQVVTGHYGDGGVAAALFQVKTQIPFTFTMHSPGALKMEKLGVTPQNLERLNQEYRFDLRLCGERRAMENSYLNIVSTKQERFEQYGHRAYQGAVSIQNRRRFAVVPPGVNTRIFYPGQGGGEKLITSLKKDLAPSRWELPGIIASSRLERKKNHQGLVEAYAQSSSLQERANLLLALRGIPHPWQGRGKGEAGRILQELLYLIQKRSLQGKVAFLDIASQAELAQVYRYLSHQGGVFALTAHYEPFGLAPLEAMACGLPVVVTKKGGPTESLQEGEREYGVLVDPASPWDIARGLSLLLEDRKRWQDFHYQGMKRVRTHYTWEQTGHRYQEILSASYKKKKETLPFPWPERISTATLLSYFSSP